MKYYIKAIKNYVNFKGRAHREEYWMYAAVHFGFAFLCGVIEAITKTSILSSLYAAVLFLPGLAVGFRRIQDTGRSGAWLFCPFANLYFLCCKGDVGPNAHGPDPLDGGDSVPVEFKKTA